MSKRNVIKSFLSLFLVITLFTNQSHEALAITNPVGNGYNSLYYVGGFNKAVGVQIRCIYGSQGITDIAKSQWNGVSSKVKLVTTYSDNEIWTYFDCYDQIKQGNYGVTVRYNGSTELNENNNFRYVRGHY